MKEVIPIVEKEYSLKEAAEILEKSYVTVLKYAHAKKIKAFRRGGQWYVLESELNRFIREGNAR